MKLDLHIHSNHSHDSASRVQDIIKCAAAAGLDGIAITDHNSFNGSLEAMKLAPEGLVIIPGAEYSTDKGHFLVYFLKEGLENKGLPRDFRGRFFLKDIINEAHKQGALVFNAHPFKRGRAYDYSILSSIDGIEAYNSRASLCRKMNANPNAIELASSRKIAFSAGSDAHWLSEIGHAYWECNPPADLKGDALFQYLYTSMKTGDGHVYGTATMRFYEPLSQLYKNLRAIRLLRLIRPIIKLIYSSIFEALRLCGIGAKPLEGRFDMNKNL